MPTVTGLRKTRGGRIAVELDGARWRTFSPEVIVRVRLGVGEVLDRPRLRELARERRRVRALETALRAVARRDQSASELRRRLKRRRMGASDREEALGALARVGLVDDARYAARRAESLAERGHGNAAIRWRLEREGVGSAEADAAVAALEPEAERARRLVSARGAGPRAAHELARRGFGEEAIEQALSGLVADGT
ncbi:MAG TPA: RecX family transcriptional regulator [Gaiellaceae bacterium]